MKSALLRQPRKFATGQKFKKVLAFAPDGKDKATKAKVKFSIKKKVPFGSSIAVIGECKQLGSWKVEDSQTLSWNEGHQWTQELELLPEPTSYKYIVISKEGVEWQPSSNLQITPSPTKMICVEDSWDGSSHIVELPVSSPTTAPSSTETTPVSEPATAIADEVSIPKTEDTTVPADLSKLTLKALRALCSEKNLPITGSKKELVARIQNA